MKEGDMVNVVQTLGCGQSPRRTRDWGSGIIVNITKAPPLFIKNFGSFDVGDDVEVFLSSGSIKIFNSKSVKVINER